MKKQLIIGISLLIGGIAFAQDRMQNFYILGGAGGHHLSTEFYNSKNTSSGGGGFQLSGGFNHFFNQHWGVQMGIGVQLFNATSTLNFKDSIQNQIDTDGDIYNFYAQYDNWKEKQSALMFEVPISLLYRQKLSEKIGLLLGAGAKVSFPISTTYKLNGGSIITSGYYSLYNVTISDLPQNGFPKIVDATNQHFDLKKTSDYGLKPSAQLIVDLGVTYKLTSLTDLYIGGYVNYGLNNIAKLGNAYICAPAGYNVSEQKFIFNYKGVHSSSEVSKVQPISVGVKIGIYFGIGGKSHSNVKEMEEMESPIIKIIDTDADGVPDNLDKCSDTPREAIGFVDSDGCPKDSDGDGIPDYLDKSPNTPRGVKVDSKGIPYDSDGDGVPDYLDKCENTPKAAVGFVDKNGCPLDTDGDGISDYLDKCPTIFGAKLNNGCPEIKQELKTKFEEALQGIQFETSKYIIKRSSFKILNDIAKLLIDNPNYLVEVQGHTDNIGNAEDNLLLSEKRAQAVLNYLVSKGVEVKRMKSQGFGETKPVAENSTKKGQAKNRRVEFIISFEK